MPLLLYEVKFGTVLEGNCGVGGEVDGRNVLSECGVLLFSPLEDKPTADVSVSSFRVVGDCQRVVFQS